MSSTIAWIIAAVSSFAFAALALAWALLRRPKAATKPLPVEWSLTPRPVFSADERRVHRLLKDALPHHVILAKLPLVRFCQPVEAQEVRYWFELLGAIHVTFAICSPNGRVLAALDIENSSSDRNGGTASRSLQIKQSVLGACRVRYLRCAMDRLPTAAELQLLVPYSNARGPQPAPSASSPARSDTMRLPRRSATQSPAPGKLWEDSSMFSDSFFAPDSRFDGSASGSGHFPSSRMFADSSIAAPLGAQDHYPDEAPNDIVGVVVDSPRYGNGPRQR